MKKHKISHPFRNSQNNNEKFFSFVLGLLLFFCPFAVQAEDIELMPQEETPKAAPSLGQMSDEAIRYLQGEDMYQGTLSWQGNKASNKFNYDMKEKKR